MTAPPSSPAPQCPVPASDGIDGAAVPHVVVVGFGPVAARLLDELHDAVADGALRLTILGAEPQPAYQRIRLGDVSVGRTAPEDLALADDAELVGLDVDVRCGVTATAVHAATRVLTLSDGSALHYDRLVLATGAEAIMPHMQVERRRNGAIDAELSMRARRAAEAGGDPGDRFPDGVMALRTMEDATTLRAAVAAGEPVVVLGGGVLGVEAALAVAEVGSPVTLVHRGTAPMGRQVDADSGQLLRRELVAAGVDVRSSTDIHTVVSDDGRLAAVRTSRDEKLPARLLVACCGVRPRHELAFDAGLPTKWGVHVDRDCRSLGDEHVFAIGDCASHEGRDPSGLIGPGWEQAELAAGALRRDLGMAADVERDAAGRPVDLTRPDDVEEAKGAVDDPRLEVILMKSKTLSVACAGTTQVDPWAPEAPTVSTWSDPQAGQYLRIVTEGERLLGFVSVGMARAAAELAMHATRGTLPVADRTALVAAQHATAEQDLGDDDVLCRCSGATAGMVSEAAETCSTVDEVGAACRAGTGCGTCRSSIEKVLAAAPTAA
ncbi:FAD-dependent oxidoreductase [Nesterenkonia halophila]|uniref:FAD-dependent oxidoreductase n=1 Tax=Nesterenkonia halophila TaxID=302044 RepID=UPI0012919E94|nr:FAD-dependent oxidoreductase [Nesterenkonia halophila]